MLALGRIVQLKRLTGDALGSLKGARDGFKLAVQLDDLAERAAFKGDEARALLQLKRFGRAAAAARRFRRLAQNAYDDRMDLSACGVMVSALTGLGRNQEAAAMADTGLAQARALGDTEAIGDFLSDQRRLKSLEGDHAGAMDKALEAACAYAAIGLTPRVRGSLGQAAEAHNALVASIGPTQAAGPLFNKLAVELELLKLAPPDLQNAIVNEAVHRLTRLVKQGPDQNVAAGIAALQSQTQVQLTTFARLQPAPLVYLAKAFAVFEAIADGRGGAALATAKEADALAGSQLANLILSTTGAA
jgi:hypothetical protein